MATLVRFKSILAGTYGDATTGLNLVSTYRSAYSGDGGISLDYYTVRDDFRSKLIVDLKNRLQPVYGFSSAKIVTATSVTTRIGIQFIFNPVGYGGEYVSYTDNAGITLDGSPAEALRRWQEGDITTSAYAITQDVINLGISTFASVFQNPTKQPWYFTDGTTMGMVIHPGIDFYAADASNTYGPEAAGLSITDFQLGYADQWGTATRANAKFLREDRGTFTWESLGESSTLGNYDTGPWIVAENGTQPIFSNYVQPYCNGGYNNYSRLWSTGSRVDDVNSYSATCL